MLALLTNPLAKWAAIALAGALAVAGFMLWLDAREQAAVKADRAAANAAVAVDTRKADERAHGAVAASEAATKARVDAAREAASESDDPLAEGLAWLRGK